MSKQYKDSLKGLGERLKSEPPKTPIQEVRPVESQPAPAPVKTTTQGQKKKESHVNFWMPEELMERLKIYSAKSKKSIKQLGIEAIEEFLNKNEK
ncbi:hypothetical protein M0L20_29465 [Spirosoma sp. RP8]|uniref:CopG family transcriptional regulator n=1 Tax=Spirosoma liriopis TaxID=2937440 RepID=A0ABT0HV11_9BACT|nr:hypothetical protein [Spirosoma liriopis]MCK8496031.1 hypothetical protein [Spirosoma liriopis]